MENSELTHWGIKGMKWGVRRYQNKDGSLTAAGKKRYGDDEGIEKSISDLKKVRQDAIRKMNTSKTPAGVKKQKYRRTHAEVQIQRLKLKNKALDPERKISTSENKFYEEYRKKRIFGRRSSY